MNKNSEDKVNPQGTSKPELIVERTNRSIRSIPKGNYHTPPTPPPERPKPKK